MPHSLVHRALAETEISLDVVVCSVGSLSLSADRREEGSDYDFCSREVPQAWLEGKGEGGLGSSRAGLLLQLPSLLGRPANLQALH